MKNFVRTERVVGFNPESVKAPVVLRCAAFLIDYVILVVFPILALMIGRLFGNDGSKLLNSEISSLGWGLALLVGLANLVLLPLYSGQSLGKTLTGLRIVTYDGTTPSIGALLLRHTLGYIASALPAGAGFLMAFAGSSGRALHDRMAKTHVIFARRKPMSEE